jgi:hypothetical protein
MRGRCFRDMGVRLVAVPSNLRSSSKHVSGVEHGQNLRLYVMGSEQAFYSKLNKHPYSALFVNQKGLGTNLCSQNLTLSSTICLTPATSDNEQKRWSFT